MGTDRMKHAFVASGGGLKAYAFHLGVLRALEEGGFRRVLARDSPTAPRPPGLRELSCYIGSSAGACVAASVVFYETLDEAEGAIGLNDTPTRRFGRAMLFRPNWHVLVDRSGLFSAEGVEDFIRGLATIDDFRLITPEVFVCATQLNGSRKVIFGPADSASDGGYDPFVAYYNDVPISKAVAASASVPGVFRPYRIRSAQSGETYEYTDGEVRETLSLHVARDHEVDLAVVSNVWMPYHYDPRQGSISRLGLGAILTQTVTQIIEQKVDRFRNEFDRHAEAVEAIREIGRTERLEPWVVEALIGKVSTILRFRKMDQIYVAPARDDTRFNLLPAWTFDPKKLGFARDVGYERARDALSRWRATQPRRARPSLRPVSLSA